MPSLTDEDKVIRNDVGKRIAAAIESLSAPEAEKVSYDNTESGMTADNAQDAIDELKSDIDSVKLEDLDDVNLTSPQDEDELHYDSATSKWKNIAKKIYEKSASGVLVSFNDGGDNIPLKSLIANITAVQAGSGTPAPDNVRNISGWSGINVSRTGKNLIIYTLQNATIGSDGQISASSAQQPYDMHVAAVIKGQTYTIKSDESSNVNQQFVGGFFYNKPAIGSFSYDGTRLANTPATFTAPITGYVAFRTTHNYSLGQCELGSSATTYEAPTGTQIALPFGQTVYGGTLDVLSGVLTVTHGFITCNGSENWTEYASGKYYAPVLNVGENKVISNGIATTYKCNRYKLEGIGNNQSYTITNDKSVYFQSDFGRIWIYDSAITTLSALQTSLSSTNLQVAYELATPTTIQLTPAQVSTLLGLNNIFADTGDISLSYFTQNANAINDIAESNTRTALNTDVPKTDLTDIFVTGTKNNTGATISAGTYFYVNGQLALCKSAISANADLTLNTNYELVTAGVLNKLTSKHAITITEEQGVSSDVFVTGGEINGLVTFMAQLRVTASANAWTNIATINYKPSINFSGLVLKNSTGTPNGMIQILSSGVVRIFPTSALSANDISFTANYST